MSSTVVYLHFKKAVVCDKILTSTQHGLPDVFVEFNTCWFCFHAVTLAKLLNFIFSLKVSLLGPCKYNESSGMDPINVQHIGLGFWD